VLQSVCYQCPHHGLHGTANQTMQPVNYMKLWVWNCTGQLVGVTDATVVITVYSRFRQSTTVVHCRPVDDDVVVVIWRPLSSATKTTVDHYSGRARLSTVDCWRGPPSPPSPLSSSKTTTRLTSTVIVGCGLSTVDDNQHRRHQHCLRRQRALSRTTCRRRGRRKSIRTFNNHEDYDCRRRHTIRTVVTVIRWPLSALTVDADIQHSRRRLRLSSPSYVDCRRLHTTTNVVGDADI